jgi:aminoglycoside phosphotransferase family enzyme/predicted kinase
MQSADQAEVIRFLEAPSTHGGDAVERLDSHASIVFLAGALAWKLKRAVRYDYLDFSTADRRRAMCEREIAINRRTAPSVYRRVVPVTREAGGALALGGAGSPVDWLIEMSRFDGSGLFDRLAARGALPLELMAPLASSIARLHEAAERRPDHGGRAGMAWVIDGNAAAFARQGIAAPGAIRLLTDAATGALERHAALLDRRRAHGFVRQCHGDLHLRNIVLLDGRPTLFDAIEFNDEIACTDVLYDLAFLLMDLWRRQLPRHANAVWNAYLTDTLDLGGIPLLPLFLSCRAAVRAKTSATAAGLDSDARRKSDLQDLARDYLAMAGRLLRPPSPCLVAVGGLSGSGKSTLAKALAPRIGACPGAVVVRSDEIRKQLCGVDPLERLGPEGYTTAVTQRVYSTMGERAAQVVQGGHTAIVDAVFARMPDRQTLERLADAWHVPFVGIWLDAPGPELIARAGRRHHDASDADAGVIRKQITQDAGAITWHRIDASRPLAAVLSAADGILREYLNEDDRPAPSGNEHGGS